MRTKIHFLVMLTLILGLSVTSCVPAKKLKNSEAQVDRLRKESVLAQNRLNQCNEQVKLLSADKNALQSENALIQGDLKSLATTSNMTIADQAKRLKRLQDIIQGQREVMANLKNSIASALMNYKSDELSVYVQDGKVYVSLSEKLLFKSGSDQVDPKGRDALKSLASVLANTKDITVMIEGHTDNVPIKTKLFKDNWDLSTARATSIVRILTKDTGIDPGRMTASGRSEFHPVKGNETAEGRTENRRTEVVLSPDMKELYNLLYQ